MIPILHCQIGTGNYQVFEKLLPYLMVLDPMTASERSKRFKIVSTRIVVLLEDKKEQLISTETNHAQVTSQLTMRKGELLRDVHNTRSRLKTAQSSRLQDRDARILSNTNRLNELKLEINNCVTGISQSKKTVDSLNTEIKTLEAEVSILRQNVKELVKCRSKKSGSLYTIIKCIMQAHGVDICAYHGGTLTGKSIQTFCSLVGI